MKGIFKIVCLGTILFPGLVSSAPAKKKPVPKPTKHPAVVIHCTLRNDIRLLISELPGVMGFLENKVYDHQRLVSVHEKRYLHDYLHLHPTRLYSSSAQSNGLVLSGPIKSNRTVPRLVNISTSVISCSICALKKSKKQYKRLSNSSKVVKAVDDIKNELLDLLSEIRRVGKAIKPGSTYVTTCGTCQVTATHKKRSRKQIAVNLAVALETLHAQLEIMKNNFAALKKVTCPTTLTVQPSN